MVASMVVFDIGADEDAVTATSDGDDGNIAQDYRK